MTTKINGTNTAANPAITGADTDTGLSFGTDTVNINTGGTTRATVDSAGALNIGQTTAGFQSKLTVGAGTSDEAITILTGTSSGGALYFADGTSNDDSRYRGWIQYNHGSDYITFGTAASERMRIDSSGRVGIGTTNPEYLLNVVKGGVDMCRFQQTTNNESDGYECILMKHAAATSGQNGIGLRFQNSGGTTVGKIDFGQSSTQYRTSSDYRLKENATAISDGITRLKTLKPYRFNWIAEKGTPKVDGFFAHEVTAVPEAISGTKDEVDSDNKPVYQGIDQSKLVPLLTAALQEAVAKIETLETEVNTLKTKVAALEAE